MKSQQSDLSLTISSAILRVHYLWHVLSTKSSKIQLQLIFICLGRFITCLHTAFTILVWDNFRIGSFIIEYLRGKWKLIVCGHRTWPKLAQTNQVEDGAGVFCPLSIYTFICCSCVAGLFYCKVGVEVMVSGDLRIVAHNFILNEWQERGKASWGFCHTA